MKVDCGAQRGAALSLPVLRNGVPGVLGALVVPTGRGGLSKAAKKDSGEDREYKNTVVAHVTTRDEAEVCNTMRTRRCEVRSDDWNDVGAFMVYCKLELLTRSV